MATAAQINANRENAQSSTGPSTEAGKAASSQNHLTLGLYTRQDYVKAEERDLYKEFCDTMNLELSPEGLLEQSLTSEITGATWRLRRCNAAEGALGDFDDSTDKTRRSIERARASAHSILHRSINQLRKIQTDRTIRFELSGVEMLGLTDFKQVSEALRKQQHSEKGGPTMADIIKACEPPAGDAARAALVCHATQAESASNCHAVPAAVPTPRNAPCPCHSGAKFKTGMRVCRGFEEESVDGDIPHEEANSGYRSRGSVQ
jgi:hypothetical protein